MTLDKPVKTYLMAAIKTAIEGISQIEQVKYGQGIPIDQDTAVYPWACFFDELESKKDNNRITEPSFDLIIQTWVKKGVTTIDEQMDIIDAELNMALLSDVGIKHYSKLIAPDRSEKFVVDDQETGIIQSIFRMVYTYAWKNPYELVKG